MFDAEDEDTTYFATSHENTSHPADLNLKQHHREELKCGFLILVTCLKKEFQLTTTVELCYGAMRGN